MPDIFGREVGYGGAFRPEGTRILFAGGAPGAIVNNVTINYEQGISRLWDLGSGNAYFVVGHTNGTFGMGTVATAGGLDYDVFGTPCGPGHLSFNGESGFCEGGEEGNFTLHYTILSQVGISVNSSDMIISQATSGTFLYLSTGSLADLTIAAGTEVR
jgi:hypothetical protein